jgi:hypothetical protein
MLLFGFGAIGSLFYSLVLLINAMAVLSEDRFLARIGFSYSSDATTPAAFGATYDPNSFKSKLINLIASVRTVARSKFP